MRWVPALRHTALRAVILLRSQNCSKRCTHSVQCWDLLSWQGVCNQLMLCCWEGAALIRCTPATQCHKLSSFTSLCCREVVFGSGVLHFVALLLPGSGS